MFWYTNSDVDSCRGARCGGVVEAEAKRGPVLHVASNASSASNDALCHCTDPASPPPPPPPPTTSPFRRGTTPARELEAQRSAYQIRDNLRGATTPHGLHGA